MSMIPQYGWMAIRSPGFMQSNEVISSAQMEFHQPHQSQYSKDCIPGKMVQQRSNTSISNRPINSMTSANQLLPAPLWTAGTLYPQVGLDEFQYPIDTQSTVTPWLLLVSTSNDLVVSQQNTEPFDAPVQNYSPEWIASGSVMSSKRSFHARGNMIRVVSSENPKNQFFTKNETQMCYFCKKNKETRTFYTSHNLKSPKGIITCPVLRDYTCPICSAHGDNAHTLNHCPQNVPRRRSRADTGRNSRGIIGSYHYYSPDSK